MASAFLTLCAFVALITHASALSYTIFAARRECVETWIPEEEWSHLQQYASSESLRTAELTLAFFVMEPRGAERREGLVEYEVLNPEGAVLRSSKGTARDQVTSYPTGNARGPWKLCIQVSHNDGVWRSSALVQLSYFEVHLWNFKHLVQPAAPTVVKEEHLEKIMSNPDKLPTTEEINYVQYTIHDMFQQLNLIHHEQLHLTHRAEAQIKNIEKMNRRAVWSAFGGSVLFAASMAGQFVAVVLMLRGHRIMANMALDSGWGRSRKS